MNIESLVKLLECSYLNYKFSYLIIDMFLKNMKLQLKFIKITISPTIKNCPHIFNKTKIENCQK